MRELERLQMHPFGLDRRQYAPVPWQQLRDAVAHADGVVICGFRQLRVVAGEWRPGTAEAQTARDWYATPWNQIEAGMAIMADVPILLAADAEVTDGVFANDVWGDSVFGLPGTDDKAAHGRILGEWAAAVSGRAAQRANGT